VNRRASQNKSPNNYSLVSPLQISPLVFYRTVENLFDIICDGVNPSVGVFNFSLVDVPNSTEFTALFDLYRIDRVECTWYPEYTELTDAALVSNAVNVLLNTAIDPVGQAVTSVADILQFRTLKATSITKEHTRSFVPSYLLDGISPVSSYLSTASPSSNWFGVSYGVVPTGIAMTLRSRVKFVLSMAQSR